MTIIEQSTAVQEQSGITPMILLLKKGHIKYLLKMMEKMYRRHFLRMGILFFVQTLSSSNKDILRRKVLKSAILVQ